MNDNDSILLSFTKEELILISHSLYQTNNKLEYARVDKHSEELSAFLQRRINGLIK